MKCLRGIRDLVVQPDVKVMTYGKRFYFIFLNLYFSFFLKWLSMVEINVDKLNWIECKVKWGQSLCRICYIFEDLSNAAEIFKTAQILLELSFYFILPQNQIFFIRQPFQNIVFVLVEFETLGIVLWFYHNIDPDIECHFADDRTPK